MSLELVESLVSYRVIDLVKSYVYYEFVKLSFLELYLKTFIRIFCTVIILFLSEIYLFIFLFIYLFNLFIYFIYLPDINQKYIYKRFISLYSREFFIYYDL